MEKDDLQVIMRIQELKRYFNLNNERLAELTSVSKASVSRVMSFKSKATPEMIDKIAAAFPGVDQVYITTGSGDLIKKGSVEEAKSYIDVFEVLSKVHDHEIRLRKLEKSFNS